MKLHTAISISLMISFLFISVLTMPMMNSVMLMGIDETNIEEYCTAVS